MLRKPGDTSISTYLGILVTNFFRRSCWVEKVAILNFSNCRSIFFKLNYLRSIFSFIFQCSNIFIIPSEYPLPLILPMPK